MPNAIALLSISAGDAVVVVTSITLVFAMLVALCLIVNAEGKLFDAVAARKKAQQPTLPKPAAMPAAVPAPAPAAAAPKPAAPAVESGIPAEVVAAIAAAVYTLEGEGAVVHSVRRLPGTARGSRRGAWGDAGVAQNTRPFM